MVGFASLSKVRRNIINLEKEEGAASQTPDASLEGARSLLVPKACQGPSVLHREGGLSPHLGGCRAWQGGQWRRRVQSLEVLCPSAARSWLLREAHSPRLHQAGHLSLSSLRHQGKITWKGIRG